ncbi:hypothetical protein BV25DRAFT_1804460, partial [Artomyces pyxidatus]
ETGERNNRSGHWRIFLDFDRINGDALSVELNSQRLYTGDRFDTRLFIVSRPYYMSNKRFITSMTFAVNPSIILKVQDVINLLLQRNRDMYILNTQGSGCRFWCETVLSDFEQAQWLLHGTHRAAWEFGITTARQYPLLLPEIAPQGTFFA